MITKLRCFDFTIIPDYKNYIGLLCRNPFVHQLRVVVLVSTGNAFAVAE